MDAEYDDIKQVWTKLSAETDTLYQKLKEKTPTAKDPDYDFETDLFKQYKSAFSDDVDALN
ncbi:hypothetical protein D3C78_1705890 [compost metagenome]